ncbi:hypothetical protein KVT40_008205 [Elsinoe batatas]|uniref:Uncharacterized protein n=1 Tax=Elsinoe batatas TaxID=2601811 RepID=A0A8K0KUX9_9PEZI|nr:hypothetical protein KVT40_008205 [Elsinoe batatas]
MTHIVYEDPWPRKSQASLQLACPLDGLVLAEVEESLARALLKHRSRSRTRQNATRISVPATVPFWFDADVTGTAITSGSIAYYNTLPPGGLNPISPCTLVLFPAYAVWVSNPAQPVVGTITQMVESDGNEYAIGKTCTQAIVDQIRANLSDPSIAFGVGGRYGGVFDQDCNFLAYFQGTRNMYTTTDTDKYQITNADGAWEKSTILQLDDGQPHTQLNLGYAIDIQWNSGPTRIRFSSRFTPEKYYTDAWSAALPQTGWILPALTNYFPELGTAIDQCQPVNYGTSPNTLTSANFMTNYVYATTGPTSLAPPEPTDQPGGIPQPPGPTPTTTLGPSSPPPKPSFPSTRPSREPVIVVPEPTFAVPQRSNTSPARETPALTSRPARPPPVLESPATRVEPVPVLPASDTPAPSPDPSRIISIINNLPKQTTSSGDGVSASEVGPSTPANAQPAPLLPAIIIGGTSTLLPGTTATISGHEISIQTFPPSSSGGSAAVPAPVAVIDSSTVALADLDKALATSLPELRSDGLIATTVPANDDESIPVVVIGGTRTLLPGSAPVTVSGKVISIPTLAAGSSPSEAAVVVDGVSIPVTELNEYLSTAAHELSDEMVATEIDPDETVGSMADWIMSALGKSGNGAVQTGGGQNGGRSSNGTGVSHCDQNRRHRRTVTVNTALQERQSSELSRELKYDGICLFATLFTYDSVLDTPNDYLRTELSSDMAHRRETLRPRERVLAANGELVTVVAREQGRRHLPAADTSYDIDDSDPFGTLFSEYDLEHEKTEREAKQEIITLYGRRDTQQRERLRIRRTLSDYNSDESDGSEVEFVSDEEDESEGESEIDEDLQIDNDVTISENEASPGSSHNDMDDCYRDDAETEVANISDATMETCSEHGDSHMATNALISHHEEVDSDVTDSFSTFRRYREAEAQINHRKMQVMEEEIRTLKENMSSQQAELEKLTAVIKHVKQDKRKQHDADANEIDRLKKFRRLEGMTFQEQMQSYNAQHKRDMRELKEEHAAAIRVVEEKAKALHFNMEQEHLEKTKGLMSGLATAQAERQKFKLRCRAKDKDFRNYKKQKERDAVEHLRVRQHLVQAEVVLCMLRSGNRSGERTFHSSPHHYQIKPHPQGLFFIMSQTSSSDLPLDYPFDDIVSDIEMPDSPIYESGSNEYTDWIAQLEFEQVDPKADEEAIALQAKDKEHDAVFDRQRVFYQEMIEERDEKIRQVSNELQLAQKAHAETVSTLSETEGEVGDATRAAEQQRVKQQRKVKKMRERIEELKAKNEKLSLDLEANTQAYDNEIAQMHRDEAHKLKIAFESEKNCLLGEHDYELAAKDEEHENNVEEIRLAHERDIEQLQAEHREEVESLASENRDLAKKNTRLRASKRNLQATLTFQRIKMRKERIKAGGTK